MPDLTDLLPAATVILAVLYAHGPMDHDTLIQTALAWNTQHGIPTPETALAYLHAVRNDPTSYHNLHPTEQPHAPPSP